MQSAANIFPGVIYTILILAFLFALPLSFLLIYRYKKSLIKGMGYASVKFQSHHVTNIAPESNKSTPEFKIVEVSALRDDTSAIYFKLKETLGYHWFVYGAMCLVFAGIISWCSLQSFDSISIWRFSYCTLIYLFPFLPVSFLLLANGWKQSLIIASILFFVFITCTYIIWAEAALNNISFSAALLPMFIYNVIPVFIISIFRLERIKAIGMFVYSFFIICATGPAMFAYYLTTHPASMESIGYVFLDLGFKANGVLLIWTIIPFLLACIIGWVFFKQLKNLYTKKWINDIQLNADSIMLLFNITYSVYISFSGAHYAIVSLLAFPAYKLTGYVLFYFLRKRKVKAVSPRMLLLRVFALGDDSRNLFERVLKHWRYAGSIQMISGPDLATTTFEPHEVISFVSGNLKDSFCEDEISIERNISNADTIPDMDGTHRVNEFFCRDNNWKEVLNKLVESSEVVLMDLRSFSEKFKGCKYEIEALINLVSIQKMIFVIDKKTDIDFTKKVFVNAFQIAGPNSPNKNTADAVNFYMIDSRKDKNVFRLLNLICSKIE